MSTTKRESLHQVQKSYQHAILLHPQGSHPKEIKILTHSLHGQIGGGHVVCLLALFVETIDKLLVRMIDTINPQSN